MKLNRKNSFKEWIRQEYARARRLMKDAVDTLSTRTMPEDVIDAQIARRRLQEIEEDPDSLIGGDDLKSRLDKLTR